MAGGGGNRLRSLHSDAVACWTCLTASRIGLEDGVEDDSVARCSRSALAISLSVSGLLTN